MALKLRSTRPLDGFTWMTSGVRLMLRYPLSHLASISMMCLLLLLAASFPVVGPTLAMVLLPAFSAGWVLSSAQAIRGQQPSPLRLLAPWRSPRRGALLRLGLMHAACAWLLLWLADALDPDFRSQWASIMASAATEAGPAEDMVQAVQGSVLLRGALLLPLALLFWHAPVIALQGSDQEGGAAKALFASVLASGRNITTFAVFGVSWLLADLLFSVTLVTLLAAFNLASTGLFILLPMSMLFVSAFYASLHASISGCIEFSQPAAAVPTPPAPAPEEAPPPPADPQP